MRKIYKVKFLRERDTIIEPALIDADGTLGLPSCAPSEKAECVDLNQADLIKAKVELPQAQQTDGATIDSVANAMLMADSLNAVVDAMNDNGYQIIDRAGKPLAIRSNKRVSKNLKKEQPVSTPAPNVEQPKQD